MASAGFSLLELLFAICLVAILAIVGISSWRDLHQRNQLAQATKQLASFLHEVQVEAHTHNSTYHLYLFTSPWCLLATQGDMPTSCQGDFYFINLYPSVVIDGLTNKKRVSFWGRRNMAQMASFQLQNAAGTSRVLISFRSRVRMCAQDTYLSGIPKC